MLDAMLKKMLEHTSDEVIEKMTTDNYHESLLELWTTSQKLGIAPMLEATIRANSGKSIHRPLGSPINHSHWDYLYMNSVQLHQMPTTEDVEIDTTVTIGPRAKRPLKLKTPIMITAMSYGGSLSPQAKVALAKGASLAGTASNTGESALPDEERQAADYLIGQVSRNRLMTEEDLSQLDAIELRFGQGAHGGNVPEKMKSASIDENLRETWRLEEGEDMQYHSRLEGVNSADDAVEFINRHKENYDVPVGVKIAATHNIEKELEVITRTEADFIVIDGAEGGTGHASSMLQDTIGIPTIYGISRAVHYLEKQGLRDKYQIIAAGGMKGPAVFSKALALGADAVYIGSIALMAMAKTQVEKPLPFYNPPQLVISGGKMADELDIDQSALNLSKFLKSCLEDMKKPVYALGRTRLSEITREDLVSVDPELARVLGVGYVGEPNV
ncbi:FMN-binding glutamate synthase family protein [Bacillus marinisedimentorum]|uniref:FMN-binding glutamate synthase family protein n=1 Tax=Bacillus marinisedimentorum TaxID=1821260 RepID=UPI000872A997|nr:FMN-binding glutamate synthase family protein [Bacillus marinisedimentorum]